MSKLEGVVSSRRKSKSLRRSSQKRSRRSRKSRFACRKRVYLKSRRGKPKCFARARKKCVHRSRRRVCKTKMAASPPMFIVIGTPTCRFCNQAVDRLTQVSGVEVQKVSFENIQEALEIGAGFGVPSDWRSVPMIFFLPSKASEVLSLARKQVAERYFDLLLAIVTREAGFFIGGFDDLEKFLA